MLIHFDWTSSDKFKDDETDLDDFTPFLKFMAARKRNYLYYFVMKIEANQLIVPLIHRSWVMVISIAFSGERKLSPQFCCLHVASSLLRSEIQVLTLLFLRMHLMLVDRK